MKQKLSKLVITKPKYAIINENGKILQKFRLKGTALNFLPIWRERLGKSKWKPLTERLRIIKLEDYDENEKGGENATKIRKQSKSKI